MQPMISPTCDPHSALKSPETANDSSDALDGMVDVICADALDEALADDEDIFACLLPVEPALVGPAVAVKR